MRTKVPLGVWLLQCPVLARADGIEGQLILGLFIPLTIIVLILCLGRACWTWHLTHRLEEWTYDPYLDLSLRNKYPAFTEAPLSRGRIIQSCSQENLSLHDYSDNQLDNFAEAPSSLDTNVDTFDESINATTRLALATHKIGNAMVSASTETLEQSRLGQHASFQTVTHVFTFENESEDTNPSSGESSMSTKMPKAKENDLDYPPQSSAINKQSLLVPLSNFDSVYSQAKSETISSDNADEKLKQPQNPYGDSLSNGSEEEVPTASAQRHQDSGHLLKYAEKEVSVRHSPYTLKGQEPRFSTFAKVRCAQFQRAIRHFVSRRRVSYPTSRDLQRDVQMNEDRVMYGISMLRENLRSGCFLDSNDKHKTFRLGPVDVPLRTAKIPKVLPSTFKKLKCVEKRKKKDQSLHRLRNKRVRHKCVTEEPKSKTLKGNGLLIAQKSERKQEPLKWRNSVTFHDSKNSIDNKFENVVCKNTLESQADKRASCDTNTSDNEDFNENYNDIFEELFAKASLR